MTEKWKQSETKIDIQESKNKKSKNELKFKKWLKIFSKNSKIWKKKCFSKNELRLKFCSILNACLKKIEMKLILNYLSLFEWQNQNLTKAQKNGNWNCEKNWRLKKKQMF